MTTTPTEDSSDIELLDCVDDCLRNGRLMTRGNLAFELLLKRFGYERMELPGYAKDVADIAAADEEWMKTVREAEALK